MKSKTILTAVAAYIICIGSINAQETFSYKVGSNEIILLQEGNGSGNSSLLIDPDPAIIAEYIPEGTFPIATNTFLVRRNGKNILIDTGYGTRLLENLSSVGVNPEDINEILITHMHGDHIGGLVKDGAKTFPSAKLVIGKIEHDYWTSDTEMMKVPDNKRGSFLNAKQVVGLYAGNLELIDAVDIADVPAACGIYPVAAYGHTPGHIGFMVVCGGNKMFIWGDLTHAMAVQMPDPTIALTYDVDPVTAVETRLAILNYVAQHQIPIAGMHIPYPAMGTVSAMGINGYRFTPEE